MNVRTIVALVIVSILLLSWTLSNNDEQVAEKSQRRYSHTPCPMA